MGIRLVTGGLFFAEGLPKHPLAGRRLWYPQFTNQWWELTFLGHPNAEGKEPDLPKVEDPSHTSASLPSFKRTKHRLWASEHRIWRKTHEDKQGEIHFARQRLSTWEVIGQRGEPYSYHPVDVIEFLVRTWVLAGGSVLHGLRHCAAGGHAAEFRWRFL